MTETTRTNMLMDLDHIFRNLNLLLQRKRQNISNNKRLLEIYNELSGHDYTYDEIDWTQ